ncbi:hypothetical protein ET471_03055 [Xylanimonas protaetiae]|uniref:Uncharacterized protein n=1 Tax=Xylanimonas protaetiae TaxID=2509457 RepID=A0A4P6FEW0_9MICO|nr:hypothetical protein [Xylanimonas protaetiae]QAY69148.1 hypothetical protein ET471_03055 [Xylanimonas protaetiae]
MAAPSYTAWWLRRSLGAPFALRDGVPLLPPAPPATRGLDDVVLRALGGVGKLAEQRPEDWPAVLDALGPVGAAVPVRDALALWAGLAAAAVAADRATLLDPLPDRLPALLDEPAPDDAVHDDAALGDAAASVALSGGALHGGASGGAARGGATSGGAVPPGAVVVVDAGDVVVAPGRRWAQLGPIVPAPAGAVEALADLLDLPVAAERSPDGAGDPRPLDERVRALDPRVPAVWRHHDDLTVDGVRVRFWVHDGEPYAIDEASLADALADLLDAPSRAALLRVALARPDAAATLWAATAWDAPPIA